tara:strand:- start:1476 stop:2105 length:630 start_codon:yes stop_codon:yes gene_type:complete
MSKGRPKYKKRELHPEVEACLIGQGDRPSESEWRNTYAVFRRAIHPTLAALLCSRKVAQATPEQFNKIAKDEKEIEVIRYLEDPPNASDEEKERFSCDLNEDRHRDEDRLGKAFVCATYFGDQHFLDDASFLVKTFQDEEGLAAPAQSSFMIFEFHNYNRAVDHLSQSGKHISVAEVLRELEPFVEYPNYETVRRRLTQYGFLPSRAGK